MLSPTTIGAALTGWSLPVVYLALASFSGVVLARQWRGVSWPDRVALACLSAGAGIWALLAGVWIATAAYGAVGQAQSFGWAVLEVVLALSAMHIVRRAYLEPRILSEADG